MPKISVVIPTYNRKELLREAIESVHQQTFQDFEIIVVDHGSTDGTSEWVQKTYGSKVRLIPLPFCPLPACPRNRGIREATGEIIALLDDDDLWLPHKLTQQLEIWAKHPEAGWCYGMAERFGPLVPKGTPDMAAWQLRSGQVFDDLLMGNFIASCTVLIRKSLLDEVGGFDQDPELRSTEDYELWLRLAAKSPICVVPEMIGRIRIASDNVSHNLPTSRFVPEKKALDTIQRKLNVPADKIRRAVAALHLRNFRYMIWTNPAEAQSHLNASWELEPERFRTALYKTVTYIGGARAAQLVIAAERRLKRYLG